MFLAESADQRPDFWSNFPTSHSAGMFLPSGVLFRDGEPPHCGQSAAAANTKTINDNSRCVSRGIGSRQWAVGSE